MIKIQGRLKSSVAGCAVCTYSILLSSKTPVPWYKAKVPCFESAFCHLAADSNCVQTYDASVNLNVLANFSSSGVHEPDVVTAPPQILSARVRGRSLVRLASVEQVPGNLKG